jgi:hypothetical protein
VDRHLNVFLPYERAPYHEDQLTRAAMIVIRAVPLARDALLARVGAPPSGRLPEPKTDMQTRYVLDPLAVEGGEQPTVHQLISVFLSPDDRLDLSGAAIEERVREQRLDGVIRFGDELVLVIESKVVGEASSEQAKLLRLRGVEVEEPGRVVALGWHELFGDWWALLERGLLAPAERVLMEDLIAFAEEHFSHLLPFTTLRRAGEHDLRRQRRFAALLRETTGIAKVELSRTPQIGAEVMLDAAIGTRSTQRISLKHLDEFLALYTWPAELKPQAEALYQTDRAQRLIDFATGNLDTWVVRPNVYLAYRGARTVAQRLYLTCPLELAEYVQRWSGDDFAQIRIHPRDEIRKSLWPWLREHQYASADDDDRLDAFLEGLGRRDAHLRPGIEVRRLWPWSQAVDLDERHALVGEIRNAVTELLTALDEPLPPGCLDQA